MPAADTARLIAELELRDKNFTAGLARIDKGVSRLGVKTTALGTAFGVGLERLAAGGINALFGQIQSGEESLRVLQDAQAQTTAVIQSTGAAAGITAEQVRAMAEAQEDLTTVDDKTVQQGENLLLTFTKIGKDVFPDATAAIVDMAVAMNKGNAEGVDLESTAIQVGKALNDPIKGITALTRVGVTFTDQQKEQIKAFVEAGRTADAQRVILAELEREFGKAGEAAGTSGAAGVRRLSDAVEDAQVALATGLAPALDRIRGVIARNLSDPKTQAALRDLGVFLGEAAEKGLAFASTIPWEKVGDGLRIAAGFAGTLVNIFANMPPEAQAAIIALAGLNKLSGGAVTSVISELGKGLIKGVLGIQAAQVNITAANVTGAGGGVGGVAGAAKGGLSLLQSVTIAGIALGAAELIGTAIVDASGGPNAGLGREVDVAGVPVLIGVSQAAAAHAHDDATKNKAALDLTKRQVSQADVRISERLENIHDEQAAAHAAAVSDSHSEQAAIKANAATVFAAQERTRAATEASRNAVVAKIADGTSETRAVAAAVRAKKLSVTNNVTVKTSVSVRETINTQTTFKKFYQTAQ